MKDPKDKPKRLNLKSFDITEDKKEMLLNLFPEIRTEGKKIDFDRLRQALGETVDTGRERYGMVWPGKADCFKTIQAPSIGTLRPVVKESVDFEKTENLIIEGDNLEVLKLLQKSYMGKVKMIYIDPPYNTGKDFIYPDNYTESLQTYLQYTGQTDDQGRKFGTNTDTDGRFHSKWLNMMYPRLYLARNLLKDDGVIFISIDDVEVHNLRKAADELFGSENFVANVIWEKKYAPSNDAKWLSDTHDHILIFAKDKKSWYPQSLPRSEDQNSRYSNRDGDSRGDWKSSDLSVKSYSESYDYPISTPSGRVVNPPHGACWRVSKERFKELVADNRIWFGENGDNVPSIKRFLSEVKDGVVPVTIWKHTDVGHNQVGRQELKRLFDEKGFFDSPKPVSLLSRILFIANTTQNDIIMDFFAGSATTAHAVLQQNAADGGNRKFIMVQLPEPCEESSEAFKAGYKTIADITKERVRRVISKLNEEDSKKQPDLFSSEDKPQDRGFKVFKLDESNFRVWDPSQSNDEVSLEKQLDLHVDHVRSDRSDDDILYEILLKSGFSLTEKIEKQKIEGKTVYSVAGGGLLICLDKALSLKLIKALAALEPARIVCLDLGFKGNDQLKTNAVQIFKTKNIVFRTV